MAQGGTGRGIPRAEPLFCLLAFSLGPMLGTLWTSLQDWNLLRPARYIGFADFRELWSDEDFRHALRNTIYYLVGYLPLVTVGGSRVAVLATNGPRRVLVPGDLLPARS